MRRNSYHVIHCKENLIWATNKRINAHRRISKATRPRVCFARSFTGSRGNLTLATFVIALYYVRKCIQTTCESVFKLRARVYSNCVPKWIQTTCESYSKLTSYRHDCSTLDISFTSRHIPGRHANPQLKTRQGKNQQEGRVCERKLLTDKTPQTLGFSSATKTCSTGSCSLTDREEDEFTTNDIQ